MNDFELEKQNALTKTDKSHEKHWDEKIIRLCNLINKKERYFTTSSCAGRITLNRNSMRKIKNAFIYKTHHKTTTSPIYEAIVNNLHEKIIYFRQEPCALHVACKSLEDATTLLKKAKEAGLKRSGIFSQNNTKFTCELVSTEWVIAPVVKNGELLASKRFIEVLVEEANKKLVKTWEKIERLEKLLL
jgi:tRNA wybutosine-synthesizing protein 3